MTQPTAPVPAANLLRRVQLFALGSDGVTLYAVAVNETTGALMVGGTVTATVDTSALATAAKQDTGNTSLASIDGKVPAKGAATPANSVPVTGSLASAAPTTVADQTATGSAVALGSCAAGPSGVRVQNTSAAGSPNIRVGDGNITTTRGVQLAPGQWEIFAVTNANLLSVIAESGSPTVGVTAA